MRRFAAIAFLCLLAACSTGSNPLANVTYAQIVTASTEAESVLRAGAEQYIALHPTDTKSATVIRQAEAAGDAALAAMQGNGTPAAPTTPQQAAKEARDALRSFVAFLPPGTLTSEQAGYISIADVMLTTFIALDPQTANAMPAAASASIQVRLPAAKR